MASGCPSDQGKKGIAVHRKHRCVAQYSFRLPGLFGSSSALQWIVLLCGNAHRSESWQWGNKREKDPEHRVKERTCRSRASKPGKLGQQHLLGSFIAFAP